ncbi:hypothetical protein MA16_Dca020866 [Dendrobium catenatum]|uniref:Uncharacterized protein n=1 Tax=Dendrobium catenatum TaxID=906689 RepID=A0A2I0X6U9_9ASPA|nr:hypothetical protein MA16_Dca020866 [Dendrobium catenatum]
MSLFRWTDGFLQKAIQLIHFKTVYTSFNITCSYVIKNSRSGRDIYKDSSRKSRKKFGDKIKELDAQYSPPQENQKLTHREMSSQEGESDETERRRPRELSRQPRKPSHQGTEEPAQRTEHQHGKTARGHGNSKGQEETKETRRKPRGSMGKGKGQVPP